MPIRVSNLVFVCISLNTQDPIIILEFHLLFGLLPATCVRAMIGELFTANSRYADPLLNALYAPVSARVKRGFCFLLIANAFPGSLSD